MRRTICGRSRESFPIVLKTRSCSLLTTPSRSSPNDAIVSSLLDGSRRSILVQVVNRVWWRGSRLRSAERSQNECTEADSWSRQLCSSEMEGLKPAPLTISHASHFVTDVQSSREPSFFNLGKHDMR